MPQLNTYLTFDGNCAEAMRFYERTLNGKLEMMTHAESPMAGAGVARRMQVGLCTRASRSTAAC